MEEVKEFREVKVLQKVTEVKEIVKVEEEREVQEGKKPKVNLSRLRRSFRLRRWKRVRSSLCWRIRKLGGLIIFQVLVTILKSAPLCEPGNIFLEKPEC